MTYSLGAVKPWVRAAAEEIGGKFDVGTVYGIGSRSYASDHPLGLALDFMVYGDSDKGNQIAAYVQQNAGKLNVKYVIWHQRIWSVERDSEGWRDMEDRGSTTANHMDHVHVSFNSSAGAANGFVSKLVGKLPGPTWLYGPLAVGAEQTGNPMSGIGASVDAFAWITNWDNIQRILIAIAGATLILFALISMAGAGAAIRKVVKA